MSEFELPYRDVHVLSVPFGPPPEMREQFQGERAAQMARLLAQPKVMHALRLENTSSAPLTTAPALVLARGKLLAQGLLTYTPLGAKTDLEINPAVDVRAEIRERETERKANAMTWAGDSYARTDIAGSIELTNHKREPIEVEVRRSVLGLADQTISPGRVGAYASASGLDLTT